MHVVILTSSPKSILSVDGAQIRTTEQGLLQLGPGPAGAPTAAANLLGGLTEGPPGL